MSIIERIKRRFTCGLCGKPLWMPTCEQGYILDARNGPSDYAFWWGPDYRGYTSDLRAAGLYAREQYEARLGKDNYEHLFIPREKAERAVRHAVLFEDVGVRAEVARHRLKVK